MIYPSIHLNGTAKDDLLNQQRQVHKAAQGLLEFLIEAMPHGRDFYVQADQNAGRKAREEHLERIVAVQKIMNETMEIWEEIDKQGKNRGRGEAA